MRSISAHRGRAGRQVIELGWSGWAGGSVDAVLIAEELLAARSEREPT